MILLIGSTGYIGSEFKRQCELWGREFRTVSYLEVFLPRFEEYLKGVHCVINASGYTGKPNVDKCEEEKDQCIWGNIVVPMKIIEWCRGMEITYGHVSSGCIYQGRREDGNPFTECDKPNFSFKHNNCSFYSGTKEVAEEMVRTYPRSYIWRLRIPFDEEDNPRNYITKLLTYKKLVDFENSVSQRKEYVSACLSCVDNMVPYGTYNVVNSGTITTKQAAYTISTYLDKKKEFEFFESAEEFYKTAAKTHRSNCVLSNEKLKSVGIHLSDVGDAFIHSLRNWRKT